MLRNKKDPKNTPLSYKVDNETITINTNENHLTKALRLLDATGSGKMTFVQVGDGVQMFTDVSEATFYMERHGVNAMITIDKKEIESKLPKNPK